MSSSVNWNKDFSFNEVTQEAVLKIAWKGRTLKIIQRHANSKTNSEAEAAMRQAVDKALILSEVFKLGAGTDPTVSLSLKNNQLTRLKKSSSKTYKDISAHLEKKNQLIVTKNNPEREKILRKAIELFKQTALPEQTKKASCSIQNIKDIIADVTTDKNNISNKEYLQLATEIYGEKKVRHVCARYNLNHLMKSEKPLTKEHLREFQVGLNDVSLKDLNNFIDKIINGYPLTIKEQDALKNFKEKNDGFDFSNLIEIKKNARASELRPQDFNGLLSALRAPNDDYKNSVFINKLELSEVTSLPGNYLHGWINSRGARALEDEERLRLYEEIETLGASDQARYSELIAKILVKKHLFYEKNERNTLKLGMIIPAPKDADNNLRFYCIKEMMDTGLGKFGYKLVPATKKYGEDMPDILLFRSSSTLPTAMDSFTSFLTDINFTPPGYLSKNVSVDQEIDWMTKATPSPGSGMRPLLLTGHSLGGAVSQIAMLNLQESGKWPERKISLEIFDSPAISASDADGFTTWYNEESKLRNIPISLNYYVSDKDPIPLFGSLVNSSYLGNGIDETNAKAFVHKMKLTEIGSKKSEVSGLGPHVRMFFRGKKDTDYTNKEVKIHEFDKENFYLRVALNLPKVVAIILTWSTLGVAGGLKRFFFGREFHDPVIKQIFMHAIYGKNANDDKKTKIKREQIELQIQDLTKNKDFQKLDLLIKQIKEEDNSWLFMDELLKLEEIKNNSR